MPSRRAASKRRAQSDAQAQDGRPTQTNTGCMQAKSSSRGGPLCGGAGRGPWRVPQTRFESRPIRHDRRLQQATAAEPQGLRSSGRAGKFAARQPTSRPELSEAGQIPPDSKYTQKRAWWVGEKRREAGSRWSTVLLGPNGRDGVRSCPPRPAPDHLRCPAVPAPPPGYWSF